MFPGMFNCLSDHVYKVSGTLPLFVNGQLSETLLRTLRMQLLPDDMVCDFPSFMNSPLFQLHRVNGSHPISLDNEMLALHSIVDVANRQLARYKTTVEVFMNLACLW